MTTEHKAPAQKVTIRDVARQAGVSISSVSRALSRHPHVSEALRLRVEAAARSLGYEPDFLAHSLRRGDTRSVGFLVGAISNPIMADIFTSASNYLAQHGYAMILACSQNQPAADEDYISFFARRQVSGLILSTAVLGPDKATPLVADLRVPTVMLDRQRPANAHVSAVQSDHSAGAQAAVEHLLRQGHRRIALIGGPESFHPAQARLAGYYAALHAAGIAVDPTLVRSVGMTATAGYEETRSLFALAHPPTALVAGGNLILTGVLQALHELGVRIGQELALIGCDDTDLSRLHTPSITVVARDLGLIGETAARLLLTAMHQKGGETVLLPTQLLIRQSSTCSPQG
ncbi:MAG: LacI family DNA-binding transcriptional regulator [Caldilineaceae bacterium]